MQNNDKRDKIFHYRLFVLLFITILVGVFFCIYLSSVLSRNSEYRQKENNAAYFDEITATLDNNTQEAETIINDFHKNHRIEMEDLANAFSEDVLNDLHDMTEDQRVALLQTTSYAMMDCSFMYIVDGEGNVVISNFPSNFNFNVIGEGYLTEDDFNGLINGEKSFVTLENEKCTEEETAELYEVFGSSIQERLEGMGDLSYIYLTELKKNKDVSQARYLLLGFASAILDKTNNEVCDYSNWLYGSSIGAEGLVFLVDANDKTVKYGELNDKSREYFEKNPIESDVAEEIDSSEVFSNSDEEDEEAEQLEEVAPLVLTGQNINIVGIDTNSLVDGNASIQMIYGQPYFCSVKKYSSSIYGDNYIIAAVPNAQIYSGNTSVVVWSVGLIFMVVVLTIAYASVARSKVLKGERNLRKVKLFSLKSKNIYYSHAIARKIFPVSCIGIIIVFWASFYLMTLIRLSDSFADSVNIQESVAKRIEMSTNSKQYYTNYYDNQNLAKANLLSFIATLHGDEIFNFDTLNIDVHRHTYTDDKGSRSDYLDSYGNPLYSIAGSGFLYEMSIQNELDLIDIFDESGRVIASDGYDWGFRLSDNPEGQSFPFWQIIDGRREYYVQEPMKDENGIFNQYVGTNFYYYTMLAEDGSTKYVSYSDYLKQYKDDYSGPEITQHMGLFEIRVRPENVGKVIESVKPEYIIANSQVYGDGFLIGFDNTEENNYAHNVIYSPKSKFVGRTANELGIKEDAFSGSFNGFQKIDGKEYLQCYREAGDYYLATVIPIDKIYDSVRGLSWISVVFTFLLLFLWSVNMVCVSDMSQEELEREEMNPLEVFGYSRDIKRLKNYKHMEFGNLLRNCIVLIGALFLISILIDGGLFENKTALSYVLGREWDRGISIFSISACLLIFVVTNAAITLFDLFIGTITDSFNNRVSTVRHLVFAFVKYGAYIIALFYCLYLLGFDAGSLLTSAGILTAVIGIGAQNLIGDLLAGVFIVVEGAIHVGDYLNIDGFRGIVREIGIRTTAVEDDNQNIKIVTNSHLTAVINLSRKNTVIFMQLPVPYGESLDRVKEIMDKELPRLKSRVKGIKEVPKYIGVQEFAGSAIIVAIKIICDEAVRIQLERNVRTEIWRIFNENSIEIPFEQLDIHIKE